jgi:hypothetical protein
MLSAELQDNTGDSIVSFLCQVGAAHSSYCTHLHSPCSPPASLLQRSVDEGGAHTGQVKQQNVIKLRYSTALAGVEA